MNRLVNPAVLGPHRGFSHAVESEGSRTLWVSGQTGNLADGSLPDDLVGQFGQALANVKACLDEAGFPVESVVSLVIYTTDVAEYRTRLALLGEAYREVFGRHYPAVALLGVSELFDPAAKVEVMATAVD